MEGQETSTWARFVLLALADKKLTGRKRGKS